MNQQDNSTQNKSYTLKETAQILGISYNYLINKVVKDKLISTLNIGSEEKPIRRVTEQAINEYRSRQSTGEKFTIQKAVSDLQAIRNSVIISYITTSNNPISIDDPLFISDIIEDIIKKKGIKGKIPVIDLFINSFGGSVDAAYKISKILWNYADRVNAIVPIYAKSAATVICSGCKTITMIPVSELGPVDPIIENPITKERIPAKSIKIFLSYASDKARLEADKINPDIIQQLGNKIEPLLAGAYFNAINTSKEYLRILLKQYMFQNSKSSQEIELMIEQLTELHSSHGFVIDFNEAKSIGLNVSLASLEEQKLIKVLLNIYHQFMSVNQLTKLFGNELYMIHQSNKT